MLIVQTIRTIRGLILYEYFISNYNKSFSIIKVMATCKQVVKLLDILHISCKAGTNVSSMKYRGDLIDSINHFDVVSKWFSQIGLYS